MRTRHASSKLEESAQLTRRPDLETDQLSVDERNREKHGQGTKDEELDGSLFGGVEREGLFQAKQSEGRWEVGGGRWKESRVSLGWSEVEKREVQRSVRGPSMVFTSKISRIQFPAIRKPAIHLPIFPSHSNSNSTISQFQSIPIVPSKGQSTHAPLVVVVVDVGRVVAARGVTPADNAGLQAYEGKRNIRDCWDGAKGGMGWGRCGSGWLVIHGREKGRGKESDAPAMPKHGARCE